jgi:hypothetical protein
VPCCRFKPCAHPNVGLGVCRETFGAKFFRISDCRGSPHPGVGRFAGTFHYRLREDLTEPKVVVTSVQVNASVTQLSAESMWWQRRPSRSVKLRQIYFAATSIGFVRFGFGYLEAVKLKLRSLAMGQRARQVSHSRSRLPLEH